MRSPIRRLPPRAGNGTRTRDPNLGKVVLYKLIYSRVGRNIELHAAEVYCTLHGDAEYVNGMPHRVREQTGK